MSSTAGAAFRPDDEMSGAPLTRVNLTPDEKRQRLLRHAALLGSEFTLRELCLITGCTVVELLPVVREAFHAGLLCDRGRDRLGLSDEALRESLRAEMPRAISTELHRHLAQRLEAEGAAAGVVAGHLLESVLGVRDLPWVEAVAHAVQPEQPSTAVSLLARVTQGTDLRDPRWFRGAAGHAEALLASGRLPEALSTAQRALDRGAPPAPAGRLRRVVSSAHLWQGQWRPARAHAVMYAGAPDQLPTDRAEQLALAATAATLEGRSGVAAHLSERADQTARAVGAEWVERQVVALRGHVAHRNGDLTSALASLQAAVRGPTDASSGRPTSPDLWSRCALALVLGDLDRFAEAQAGTEMTLADSRTWGWVPGATLALLVSARLHADSGALDRAAAALAQVPSSSAGPRVLAPLVEAERTMVALYRDGPAVLGGDWEAALGDEPAGLRTLIGLGRRVTARARAHRLTGHEARGLRELLAGWTTCAKAGLAPDLVRLGPEVADAARRTGNTVVADEVRTTLADLSRRNPQVDSIAAAATAAEALASDDPEPLLAALSAWRDSSRRLEAAHVTELVGSALVQVPGQRARGREALRQAADGYAACGAGYEAGRAHALLRGGSPRPRTPSATRPTDRSWDTLTRTERIVASQVEQGATNAEIARRLVVSRRTVESHVSHILAKLDLRSRTELIVAAAQRERGLDRAGSRQG